MKKLCALLLALMMCFALVACGGEEYVEEPSDIEEPSNVEEPADSAMAADNTDAEISDEQLAALAQAYNQAAPLFNEAYTAAEENGWLADEQTAAEIQAVNATLGVIGQALTEDPSMLDGTDFDALTDTVLQFVPALEELVERVSVPFGG